MSAKTKLADLVMPWAAGNASVWPSQHDVHAGLLDEVRDLVEALREIVSRTDDEDEVYDYGSGANEAVAAVRQIAQEALERLGR